jgi:endonuclease III
MVTTRSGATIATASAAKAGNSTTNTGKADSKRLLGSKSRAKKTQAAPALSQVTQNSRGRRQASSGRTTSALLLKAKNVVSKKRKKASNEYFRRLTDAELSAIILAITCPGSAITPASTGTGRTLRSRTTDETTTLVLEENSVVSEKQKKADEKYIERKTDTDKTVSIRLRVGDFVGTAFRARYVNHKRVYYKGFFSNNKGFKVGHHPFLHWKGPHPQAYWDYFNALKKHHDTGKEGGLKLNVMVDPILPGHAYTGDGHKFHALIEPIISCATSNNNQKLGSDSLYRNLTYRNGKVSKISPNYHKLRTLPKEDFEVILRPSGRQNNNSKYIMALFNNIRKENIEKRGLTAEEAAKIQEDAENAEDWTDGLLSMDFMVGMGMQEMFDKLVTYDGIACKTASCIMCFSFHFAVFAVDTHVFRLCQWAGWIPRNCTRDDAFKFFTIAIPPELHRDLHQALWHHAQLCYRCDASTYKNIDNPKWKKTVCPLEQFGLDRFPGWEPKKKATVKKQATAGTRRRFPLITDTDVADAIAAGHDIIEVEYVIDDDFGASTHLSNTWIERKRYLSLTLAEFREFRKFQKSRVVTKTVRRRKITITKEVELTTTTTTTMMDAAEEQDAPDAEDGENDDRENEDGENDDGENDDEEDDE